MIALQRLLLWIQISLDRYLELINSFSFKLLFISFWNIIAGSIEPVLGSKAMPRNVEIKAKVRHVEKLEGLIYELTDSLGSVMKQEDTFFNAVHGRLKLRVVDDNPNGQLIQYQRDNQAGPTESQYSVVPIEDAEGLKLALGKALGIIGVVEKNRRLYFYGQTRIHLDEVKGLGSFMELEVVLDEDQSVAEGEKTAEEVMKKLEIDSQDLISTAYMDLKLATGA